MMCYGNFGGIYYLLQHRLIKKAVRSINYGTL